MICWERPLAMSNIWSGSSISPLKRIYNHMSDHINLVLSDGIVLCLGLRIIVMTVVMRYNELITMTS